MRLIWPTTIQKFTATYVLSSIDLVLSYFVSLYMVSFFFESLLAIWKYFDSERQAVLVVEGEANIVVDDDCWLYLLYEWMDLLIHSKSALLRSLCNLNLYMRNYLEKRLPNIRQDKKCMMVMMMMICVIWWDLFLLLWERERERDRKKGVNSWDNMCLRLWAF